MEQESSQRALMFKQSLVELIRWTGAQQPDDALDLRPWCRRAVHRLSAVFLERLADPDWFEPLMHAAISDPDPSHCRLFVEPALAAFGRRRVQEALITTLRDGTDVERIGAGFAWYWSRLPLSAAGSDYSAAPVNEIDDDAINERLVDWAETALQVFVTTNNVDVRCSILPTFSLDMNCYRPELGHLVTEAISIARTSPNEYLRHRVEVQINERHTELN